jgi:hypothetical protein
VAGELVSMHVIPKSDDEVNAILPYARFVGRYSPEESPSAIPRLSAAPKLQSPQARSPRKPAPTQRPKAAAPKPTSPAPTPAPAAPVRPITPLVEGEHPTWEQLQGMSVVKLRRYARAIPELPIKGRQISIANKDQLLAAIATVHPA